MDWYPVKKCIKGEMFQREWNKAVWKTNSIVLEDSNNARLTAVILMDCITKCNLRWNNCTFKWIETEGLKGNIASLVYLNEWENHPESSIKLPV